MQGNVEQHGSNDVDELLERTVSAWNELDQRVIDTAVRPLGELVFMLAARQ